MKNLAKSRDSESRIKNPVKFTLQDRIDAMEHRIEYRRMVDFEDREAVYHLRRNAYSRHRGESEKWGATAIDDAHEENSVTVGLFIDKRLVGSFKVTVITKDYPDCQSRNFFPEEVDNLLESGGMFIDPGRFVADTKATKEFPELPYLLIRIPIMACQYFKADACLSLIRKEHSSFYDRIFSSRIVGGPKWYPPLQIEALLMCGSVEDVKQNVLERFPCWRASYLEMRQLFGPVKSLPAVLHHMSDAA